MSLSNSLISSHFKDPASSNILAIAHVKESQKSVMGKKTAKVLGLTTESKHTGVRPFWYYLTLGIPILIETMSLFFEGIVHRAKMGEALQCRFKYKYLPKLQIDQIGQFHKYNELALSILNSSELTKAMELVNQALLNTENARLIGDKVQVQASSERYFALIQLLQKNKNPKLTRKEIDDKDWKTLDLIDYEVAQDYFTALTEVFNTSWYKTVGVGEKILKQFNVNYPQAVVAESLSMSVAYIEGLSGKTLSLPFFDEEAKIYRPVSYKIREFYLGDALPCYILESEDQAAPPWFVIRGTQYHKDRTGSFESILADIIDHKCMARNIVNKALVFRPLVREGNVLVQKESLTDVFESWKKQNKSVIVTGHSLGGTIANSVAVDFPNSIEAVYAFSSSGVARKTGLRYQQLPEKVQNKIINFDFEGDLIPSGGHCLIGRHLAIKALLGADHPKGMYVTHVRSHLNRDFCIQEVNVAKENSKFSRVLCEKIRVLVGRCLRGLLYLFSPKYLPDWWKNRKIYKQQANFQRFLLQKMHPMTI